jgi:outer membrane lipoprotein-sorting protein
MKRFLIFTTLIIFAFRPVSEAQNLSGDLILNKVDENRFTENKIIISRMTIHGRRGSRTVEAKTWQRKMDEAFTEYLAPAREKGTKMLKLGDRLWMYSPSTDRIIMISGHMLRQSVMGSDLSYEDLMEYPLLQNLYSVIVNGKEEFNGQICWILDLTAKKEDIAYHSRKIWVDKEHYVIMKENRYAKSGKLLKTTETREVTKVEGRWIAKYALFKDVFKEGKGTEFFLDSIEFNVNIPDHFFSKSSLRK